MSKLILLLPSSDSPTIYTLTLKATSGSTSTMGNLLNILLLATSTTISSIRKLLYISITAIGTTVLTMRKVSLLTIRAASSSLGRIGKLLSLKVLAASNSLAIISKVYFVTIVAVASTVAILGTKFVQAVVKLLTLTARSTSSAQIGKFLYFTVTAIGSTVTLIVTGKRYLLSLLGIASSVSTTSRVQVYATYEAMYINKITIGNTLVENIAQNQGAIPFPSTLTFRGNIVYVDIRYLLNKVVLTSPPIAANLYIGKTLIPLSYMSTVVGIFTGSFYTNVNGPQDVYVELFMTSPIKGWYASQPFRLYLTEE